ncbi:hypothetical protein BDU57DRAFT_514615 [Ampelomyces quisqualis]|uniref:Uncharacterized protein n=1 Tax=Ampelomyces quisqualis TaxID=50730 RepID=A0A6A5QW17_AMPQU|nr:hypothetical protein BDU57DRAFT_514615 [Ampelomyces quisqualis]
MRTELENIVTTRDFLAVSLIMTTFISFGTSAVCQARRRSRHGAHQIECRILE